MDRTKAGLYFHIPFCSSKCPYCDFYSLVSKGCTEEYVNALCDEMKTRRRLSEFLPSEEKALVDTVYFGGGTPSLLSGEQVKKILYTARESFLVSEDAEITAECNPSSPGLSEFLKASADAGVNRISLGMQSSSDNERRKLGRRGTGDSVKNAVELVRSVGINNISLDIMIGVPESSIETLKASLDFALSLEVSHISAYMLKIEEGTFYHKNVEKLCLPDEDMVCDMYLFMSSYLRENGFFHYEISNFCKDGFHSKHNMKYWEGAPYIGIGAAAHSFFNGKRFYFKSDLNAFINGEKAVFDGTGGDGEEEILLSLRTFRGISLSDKNSRFIKKAELFAKNGFATIKGDSFVLTAEGYLVSNTIISELLSVY